MRRMVLLLALLVPAACRREPAAPIPKTDMALYLETNRLFSCHAPAQWRVLENQGGAQRVTFLGPPEGPTPYAAAISLYYYPKSGSAYAAPQDYAKAQSLAPGKTGPLVSKPWKDLEIYEFSATRPAPVMHTPGRLETRQESTVLIPAPQGFYAVVYSAPAALYAKNEPAFRDLVDSLRFGRAP